MNSILPIILHSLSIRFSLLRFLAFCFLAQLLPSLNGAYAATSQVIGSFPEMTGGFEDELVQSPLPLVSSIPSGQQSFVWVVRGTTSSSRSAILATGGRSGPQYARFGANTLSYLVSPTTTEEGAISTTYGYVIQFYYRTSDSTAANNGTISLSADATASFGSLVPVTLNGTSGEWVKVAESLTAGARFSHYGLAIIRFAGASGVDIDVDDFVLYLGTEPDTTPPSAPGPVTIGPGGADWLPVSWAAAPDGVDGGGYLVVRESSDPSAPPNPNGIYAIGNRVGAGPGSGVVAWLGTGTSFVDTNLSAGQTYYYRVYTADKAFNYSSASAGSGTTASGTLPVRATLLTPQFNGQDVVIRFSGDSGGTYAVERADQLDGPWSERGRVTIAPGSDTGEFVDVGAKATSGFYRVKSQ